jgi:hypothetical protein
MGGLSDDVRTTFKQVEGAYLFQQNPWFFGRSYGYLSTRQEGGNHRADRVERSGDERLRPRTRGQADF